jgi:hypothetical protein
VPRSPVVASKRNISELACTEGKKHMSKNRKEKEPNVPEGATSEDLKEERRRQGFEETEEVDES